MLRDEGAELFRRLVGGILGPYWRMFNGGSQDLGFDLWLKACLG